MTSILINQIVFHHGHGTALFVIDVSGPFAYCIPLTDLKHPPKEAPGYLVSELVEINELIRRKSSNC